MHETKNYLDKETETDIDPSCSTYEELEVGPNYIDKSKSDHEEVVQTLSNTIVNSLSEENSE